MTSKSSVVDDHEHNKGGVKNGEGDEQLVEGVAHLLEREEFMYLYVSQETQSLGRKTTATSTLQERRVGLHCCSRGFLSIKSILYHLAREEVLSAK